MDKKTKFFIDCYKWSVSNIEKYVLNEDAPLKKIVNKDSLAIYKNLKNLNNEKSKEFILALVKNRNKTILPYIGDVLSERDNKYIELLRNTEVEDDRDVSSKIMASLLIGHKTRMEKEKRNAIKGDKLIKSLKNEFDRGFGEMVPLRLSGFRLVRSIKSLKIVTLILFNDVNSVLICRNNFEKPEGVEWDDSFVLPELFGVRCDWELGYYDPYNGSDVIVSSVKNVLIENMNILQGLNP